MKILGISGGFRQGYQDSAACLVSEGRVIAALEEERMSRIKFSPGRLPYSSVLEVLKLGDTTINEISILAFHGSTWGPEIDDRIQEYFNQHFGYCPPIERHHHHLCHASSAYYASGFDRALVLSLDNSGDGISFQVSEGENGEMKVLEQIARPDSLGLFYQLITQLCGYTKDSDEYKVMGLSSFGDRNRFNLDWLIGFEEGKLSINKEYIKIPEAGAPSLHKDEMVYTPALVERLGMKRRIPGAKMEEQYMDLAASAQQKLEQLMLKMTAYFMEKYQHHYLCLAGGAALNCVMNQSLMNADFVKGLFVQPAAGDAGISLGAAWLSSHRHGFKPQAAGHTYLGPSYSDTDIQGLLQSCGIRYVRLEKPWEEAAARIAGGAVIGWFQGRSEFGPRALGNRSILASPSITGTQSKVNLKVKLRESYRPFCPSLLEEEFDRFFVGKQGIAPFMTITYQAKELAKELIPEVIHVDGTAR
ncbi:MAG: hypothetical protein K1X82_15240, partial [Bacteroidia bacterium]|nr:hypothetical protein [Bacteroidia bacterium]